MERLSRRRFTALGTGGLAGGAAVSSAQVDDSPDQPAAAAAAAGPAGAATGRWRSWRQESCTQRDDPLSGARIIQLTSAAAVSNNIYCEQPYCSPDGNRVAIVRKQDFVFDEEYSLLVHDLPSLQIAMVARRVTGGIANSAWSGKLHFWTPERRLMRLTLATLEQQEVYREPDPAASLKLQSVSPDGRYAIGLDRRMEGPGAPIFQIFRLDLARGRRDVIFEDPEISNPHLQFNPVDGKRILVQNNRGIRMLPDGTVPHPSRHDDVSTTLFTLDADGGDRRQLPVGPPHTATCTGHECFVADTGQVLLSVGWNKIDEHRWTHDARYPQGNLFLVRPGDDSPTVFEAPEFMFNHLCVSRCGRYFLADSPPVPGNFRNGQKQPVSLIVGDLRSRRYRVLVHDTQCYPGGNQSSHAHAYLTADNRHVIYNANPAYGTPQVYAARIPDDFLTSLA